MSIFGCFMVMTVCFWSGYHLGKEVGYNKKDDIEEDEDYDEEME